MLDGVSLDQLRAFLAAVDEGSFSAAGRRLSRTQSAISEAIGSLETHLGVSLFDRSGRYPRLTSEGAVLVADARLVLSGVDGLKARAKGMAAGIEAELSIAVDVFFPIEALAGAATQFREQFPRTPLRLYVEALGGVGGAGDRRTRELRHRRTLADAARRARRRAPDPRALVDGRGSEPPVGRLEGRHSEGGTGPACPAGPDRSLRLDGRA